MQALPPGGVMVAVRASEQELTPLLVDGVSIAAVNGPGSVVLSGVEDAVLAVVGDRRSRRLRVSHAFHSVLMEPMLDEFRSVVQGLSFHEPVIPFASGAAVDSAEWSGMSVTRSASMTRWLLRSRRGWKRSWRLARMVR
jgi:acyl transferase domain-containing protein